MRGPYRSRRMEDILAEAQALADSGVEELLLVAQDVSRYGTDLYHTHKLPELLRALCKMDFHWIRLHYLYPDDLTEELIDTIAAEPKLVHYLDIPLQHCNGRLLRSMHRWGTEEQIVALLDNIRAKLPDAVIRTSLITGLPGEDEAAFEELCAFLRREKLVRAGVFAYSQEEGTLAARMPG
ncbi:MAG: radical SAM protein [Clostridiales bacterium]|nr:radical SAM protein [Clostridiales bacterium]